MHKPERNTIIYIIKIIIFTFIAFVFFSCSSRMSVEQINRITKKEHGFLVFTFPEKQFIKLGDMYGLNDDWNVSVTIDGEKYFSDSFESSETYKIPVPAGEHNISYVITAQGMEYFKGHTIYSSGGFNGMIISPGNTTLLSDGTKQSNYFNVKKNQVFSVTLKKNQESETVWFPTIVGTLTFFIGYPLGSWPVFSQQMILNLETDETTASKESKETFRKKRPVVLGKIFRALPGGKKVELVSRGGQLRPGMIVWIMRGGVASGKMVVSQVYHTKAVAKIIVGKARKGEHYAILK